MGEFGETTTATIPQEVKTSEESKELTQEQLVEQELKPRIEEDNAGFRRKVYTLNGITFSFKGRDEIPIYPTLKNSRTTFLGEDSVWISKEEFQKYKEEIQSTQNQEDKPEHLIVNKTLIGVVELAQKLGNKDESLVKIKEEVQKGIYSEEALNLIDKLMAANYTEFRSNKFLESFSSGPEALVLLSLLNNKDAEKIIKRDIDSLKKIDQEYKEREKEDLEKQMEQLINSYKRREKEELERPILKVEEICCVHSTHFRPETDELGDFIVSTTLDATKGKILRNTIHTALNHKVESHNLGDWGKNEYTVISSFDKMMKINGKPDGLCAVDTWWIENPGERLIFPEGILIEAGDKSIKNLYEIQGNIIKFKSEGLKNRDFLEAIKDLDKTALSLFLRKINRSLEDVNGNNWNIFPGSKVKEFLSENYQADYELLKILKSDAENKPEEDLINLIKERMTKIIKESGLREEVKNTVKNKEEAISDLALCFSKSINSNVVTRINDIAIRRAIKDLGFEVRIGTDQFGWEGDENLQKELTMSLGQEIKVPYSVYHTNTSGSKITGEFTSAAISAGAEKKDLPFTDWPKYKPRLSSIMGYFEKTNLETHRAVYASGLLTARD